MNVYAEPTLKLYQKSHLQILEIVENDMLSPSEVIDAVYSRVGVPILLPGENIQSVLEMYKSRGWIELSDKSLRLTDLGVAMLEYYRRFYEVANFLSLDTSNEQARQGSLTNELRSIGVVSNQR